jgi:FkbM family methyltransferase
MQVIDAGGNIIVPERQPPLDGSVSWKSQLARLIPRRAKPALHAWLHYVHCSGVEPELRLARNLCETDRWSVDVGAMIGYYTWWMQSRSAHVLALEPHPELFEKMRRGYGRKVTVLPYAASDTDGKAEFWRSFRGGEEVYGCSSLEPRANQEYSRLRQIVETRRLDDLCHGRVGFMKIQAEGHENLVLAVARRVVEQDAPTILAALQERHKPGIVGSVRELLERHGYHGWFIWRGRLLPIAAFAAGEHQRADSVPRPGSRNDGAYAYWFIFVPPRRQGLVEDIRRFLRQSG